MSTELPPAAAALLTAAGLSGDFILQPLSGGANNKVFRVEADNRRVVLKYYFHHSADQRDRLRTEFGFARFAWERGLRCLPEPLACDADHRLAVYEWVPGRRLRSDEITAKRVAEALDFYCALNRHRREPEAAPLQAGSEACFSLAAHLQCVERRLQRLRRISPETEVDRCALDFVETTLTPAWAGVAGEAQRHAAAIGLALDTELPRTDRRLSPSDFGYHNALLAADGYLRFLDFEYAGWDDPAKLVCDFFCQPAVPAPPQYFDGFVETVTAGLSDPALHRERIALLWPVYQIKWAGILLNDFVLAGEERRRFSGPLTDQFARKHQQLQKAQRALAAPAVESAPG